MSAQHTPSKSGNRLHAGGISSAASNFHRIQAEAAIAKGDGPTLTVLNVIRVALDRDMPRRETGFMQCEVDAAKAWVRAAIAKATGQKGGDA